MSVTRRERAIEVVEHSRQTHVKWLEYQAKYPDWDRRATGADVGDTEHHQRLIEDYDLVLAELRGDPE